MTAKLIVRPEAESDIAAAYDWYETQRSGLGGEFLDAISAKFAELERHPQHYPPVHGAIRRALLRRFPYGIFFLADDVEITVLAALHMARDPALWKKRVERDL